MTCLIAAMLLAKGGPAWYGPATVSFKIPFTGNPYDAEENDVEIVFTGANGLKLTRMGFFDANGEFSATLVAPEPGAFSAEAMLNGKKVATLPSKISVSQKLPHGFIGLKGRHFAWTDGTPYFPLGYDYAWRNGNGETVAEGMTKMGRMGCNWSRIWANHWDQKNPFWPETGQKLEGRELWQKPLQTWDSICVAATLADVHFQFVLFHHGPVSTTTDSNWKEHPWNTANGGFLADPTDFFVNPEAKRREKIWLRYAVARYASSPGVMAWELFNEVQWVDAIKKHPERAGDVAAWHKEMIAYVKSLDPYHHLVTSSSSESLDDHIFDGVDYLQPHTYPSNVLAAIGGYKFTGKPGFFGEFGPPNGDPSLFRQHVRDGIYGGMLAGHAGAGEFWFWDRVDQTGLAADYRAARKVIDESGLLTHLNATPLNISADTPTKGPVTVSAAGGWEQSKTTELDLPNVSFDALKGWSPYFQSMDGGHKEWAAPLLIKFTAKSAGQLKLKVGQTSETGGTLKGWVNDHLALDLKFPPPVPTNGTERGGQTISLDYPAGPVVVRLENHGSDWIQLVSITVPDQGATALAHGLGESDWALVRVVGTDTDRVTINGLTLADGTYHAAVFDATNSDTVPLIVTVKGGTASLTGLPKDSVVSFKK